MASTPDAASDRLAALDRLTRAIPLDGWFAAVGEPLIDAERDEARLYLDGLGFPAAAIAAAADWTAAHRLAEAPDWEPRWWEAEQAAQAALLARAEAEVEERALYDALTRVARAAGDVCHGTAAIAAARAGIAHPGLIRAAAGAAAMACHQVALVRAAGAGPDHPFAAKHRLFAAGRWPLAIVGGTFHVL